MEVWASRVAVVAAMSWAFPVAADPPETTVYFGDPAPRVVVVELSREPIPSAERAEPIPSAERAEPIPSAERAEPEVAPRACPAEVTIQRNFGGRRESMRMALLDCARRAREEARRALSVLARPRSRAEPTQEEMEAWRESGGDPELLAEDVRLVDAELLDRLQRIADAFEGHAIEIVSGYRPTAAAHSRHHHARALDLFVVDVPREALRDLAVTFEHTGVGWYPNSTFVHVDVREESTYWVDVGAPGERPRYVDPDRAERDTVPAEQRPSAGELESWRRELDAMLRDVRVDVGSALP